MSFNGKVVFVAGGTSGINFGIAQAFAAAGARVAVLSRNAEKVEAAVQKLQAAGGSARGLVGDVRNYEDIERAFEKTVQAWGEVDVLISGAAGNFVAPISKLSSNGFKTVVDIDLVGSFHVMRAAWEHLRKPGAAVLNVSAPQAWLPTPAQAHVCAAKAGIDQLTRTAAMEWGRAGVRVNAIAPGPIEGTEGMRRLAPTPESEQAWRDSVPLRRYGTLQDVAKAALWLCSPDAGYISGVVLPVDGGWSLGGSSAMTQALGA